MDKANTDSSSYIIINCSSEANPKFNRLQLRTDPPTFIELHPGENILKVEDYPALKYGFSQIEDNEDDEFDESISQLRSNNCQDIIEIDLSHFDGSAMTTMECMFDYMTNLQKLNMEGLDTSNVTSMSQTFWNTGINGNLKLKVNFNTSKVEDMTQMFGVSAGFLSYIEIINFDLSNVMSIVGMFDKVGELIIDGLTLNKNNLEYNLFSDLPEHILLRHCKKPAIDWIADNIVFFNENCLNILEVEKDTNENIEDNDDEYDDLDDFTWEEEDENGNIITVSPGDIYETMQKNSILDYLSSRIIRPILSDEFKYAYSKELPVLTKKEFIKKLLECPPDGRLVIAIPNETRGLWVPDEAVSMARLTSDKKDLELVSGYYDESGKFTPQNIDYNRLNQILGEDAKVIVDTKMYGKRKVIDVIPYLDDYSNTNFILIIVKV